MEKWIITGRFSGEPIEKKSANKNAYYIAYITWNAKNDNLGTMIKSLPIFFFEKAYMKLRKTITNRKTVNGLVVNVVGESNFNYIADKKDFYNIGLLVKDFMIYSKKDYQFDNLNEYKDDNLHVVIGKEKTEK